jgi:peroxiredoxin
MRQRILFVLAVFVIASTSVASAAQTRVVRPQFALRDVDGVEHRQTEWAGKRAVVIFYATVDCPLSNGYVPEMNRINKEYAGRGVAVYGVETDTTLAAVDVRRHAHEFQFAFPVLFDSRQYLVHLAGATATPEVAVFSSAGELLYLGRIDNRVEDFDAHRNVVTQHDLRDALDAILAGKSAPHPSTKVVGCAINYGTGKP